MNKANLKSYAPQARKDFIAAVTARANQLGLSLKAGSLEVAPAQTQGDVTVIAGQAWPSKVSGQRDKLIERIRKDGFEHTMEAVAYTWFNRFAALRYMELHDYLGHGHRALSSTAGGLPDILTHATELSNDLTGLNAAKVTELKLAGNRDGELYRMLLVAQCNALSRAMPFLFERIDDDSELLLPDNLLRSDSVIAKLVAEIPEEDWAEVEIIGWLYQFYISEKKDLVIGKVVKSEDIPAATQLFTPNWIVQYLVQNSVGRLWLMANPQSTLAKEWPYYITPAEQTPEVQAQLDALIQTRVREDGDAINPESITVLDPACGSGHILVVAYDVLKAIYLERGYLPRAIPRLILEKNLYGLDIDDRAAQMAGFALLMKARADDRRLFTATDDAGNLQTTKLNVLSLQESKGLNLDELATHLAPFNVQRTTITALVETFEHAKTFGSLIQIPYSLKTQLSVLPEVLALVKQSGDMYATVAADDLLPLVQQARLLGIQFDAVVANPPYMGAKTMNGEIKEFAKRLYSSSKSDLFAMFVERGFSLVKAAGYNAQVTMQSWMFLSSYEEFRHKLRQSNTLICAAHLGSRAFAELTGQAVQVVAFAAGSFSLPNYRPTFVKADFGDSDQKSDVIRSGSDRHVSYLNHEFSLFPGGRLAYWVSRNQANTFLTPYFLEDVLTPRQGMATSDNARFVRYWWEVSLSKTSRESSNRESAVSSGCTWFPYNKGGPAKKWFGNQDYLVNWKDDGKDLLEYATTLYGSPTRTIKNIASYFKEGLTWGDITFKNKDGEESFAARYTPTGSIFDVSGPTGFPSKNDLIPVLCLLNSKVIKAYMSILNPTAHFQVGDVKQIPYILDSSIKPTLERLGLDAIKITQDDYFEDELAPGYRYLSDFSISKSINECFENAKNISELRVENLRKIEEEINRTLLPQYGLQEQINPSVRDDEITLKEQTPALFAYRFVSIAIGSVLGRYSLDEPGLIYAIGGNVNFKHTRYSSFPADADGILPITEELWFEGDASSRIREFLLAVWGQDTLEDNIAWLAEQLGAKASETPDESIRRYIADKFFKDHLQTYKKRPIYWLFSSGKQGAFQALVYLHRYTEGTLARLRAEYVVPLTGKIQSRIEMLQKDAAAAGSTAARNKLTKEAEKLSKKHAELLAYDEQLRHYADMRITLDLDDGVKVNYGKFGDLLAEVKAVTGGASDD